MSVYLSVSVTTGSVPAGKVFDDRVDNTVVVAVKQNPAEYRKSPRRAPEFGASTKNLETVNVRDRAH